MLELIHLIVTYWPYIVGTLGVVLLISIGQYAYKLGGLPALVVVVASLSGATGYFLGRNKVAVPGIPEAPRKKRRPTIFDSWRGL